MSGNRQDIPFASSPPVLFVYQQTVNIAAGMYSFLSTTKSAFTPNRPIMPNALYLFDTLDFAMDVAEIDYQGAIITLPQFSMYMQSDAVAPSFREPIPLVKYFNNLRYRLTLMGTELLTSDSQPGHTGTTTAQGFTFNRLIGNVTGVVGQTPALLGKVSMTATLALTAQEIVDDSFIAEFRSQAGQRRERAREF
jgi:hypothetical protein